MSDPFEDIAARARTRTGGPVARPDAQPAENEDAFDRIAARAVPPPPAGDVAPPAPSPGVGPSSRTDRFLTGLGDPVRGAMQLSVNATGGSRADNWMMRALRGNTNLAPLTQDPVSQSLTPEAVNRDVAQREANYVEGRRQAGGNPSDMDWLRTGGQIAGTLPLAAVTPAGGGMMGAASFGAASGAGLNALQPVANAENFWEEKAGQAATGAAAGAAGGALARLIGRAVAPRVNPSVRALNDAGVSLTPGQVIGGFARRAEDAATSLPVIGDQVLRAQREGIESFNRAAANRVLAPLGQNVDNAAPVGREMVEEVGRRVSAAYDDAISRVRPFGPDQQFAQDIQGVTQQFLTPESRQTFARLVNDRVVSRFQNGPLDGATFKTMDSELGQIARRFSSSTTASEREIADAVRELQRSMRGLAARTNPDVAPAIRAADEAWANLVRYEGAAAAQGATEGVFTPAQLSGAVRRFDHSARDRQFAQGNALMQDLSDAGRAVLPSRIGDSGTATREAILGSTRAALLGGMVGAGSVSSGLTLPAAGAGAAVMGAYTPPAMRAFQAALLARRPAAVTAAGDAIAAAGGPVSVPLAGMLLSPPQGLEQNR
jgi:hypothetical protein